MITRDDVLAAYYKEYTSQLWLYCSDKATERDAAMDKVLAEINHDPAENAIPLPSYMIRPSTAEAGAKMLEQLLRPIALSVFVSCFELDELVALLKGLKKSTFWETIPVVAISSRYSVSLRDIADEWNRQHEDEHDKQIWLEPLCSR